MDYLLLGIVLFLLFSLLLLIIVSNAYRNWEKDLQTNPQLLDSIKHNTEQDSLYRYIQHQTRAFQALFQKSPHTTTKQTSFLFTVLNVVRRGYLALINAIISGLHVISPISKAAHTQSGHHTPRDNAHTYTQNRMSYHEQEEYLDDNITQKVIDQPHIILDKGIHNRPQSRTNPKKTIAHDDELSYEEFEKLEASLLRKFDTEKGDAKFKRALELAQLYGQMNMVDEERQLYSWILEKGNDESKAIASRYIIGM